MAPISKSFLDIIFDAFSKWNFFKSKKFQVHPTLEDGLFRLPDDNSSTDSDNEQAVGLWQDFIEEYDCLLLDMKGQKAELYLLENRPLIHEVITGANLQSITEELIQTYGLHVLNMVMDVINDPTVNRRKDTLESVIQRMEQLDYSKWTEKKIIVWIEDFPSSIAGGDGSNSLARLVLTEVMRRQIEPQMVIPCHDADPEVMKIVKNTMQKELLSTKHQDELLLDDYYETSMYLIALRIALASANCNFILIDANQLFTDTPVLRDLIEFATGLGHEVMYLRNAPNTNKYSAVDEFVDKFEDWVGANNESLFVDHNTYLHEEPEDFGAAERGADLLRKLTRQLTRKRSEVQGTNGEGDSEEDDGSSGSSESDSLPTENGLWEDEEPQIYFDEHLQYESYNEDDLTP